MDNLMSGNPNFRRLIRNMRKAKEAAAGVKPGWIYRSNGMLIQANWLWRVEEVQDRGVVVVLHKPGHGLDGTHKRLLEWLELEYGFNKHE